MMIIPDAQTDRAIHIIDTSEAADLLEQAMGLAPQGRPRRLSLRTWLIGAYLAIETSGSFKSTAILEVLTCGITIPKQHDLGVRYVNRKGDVEKISKAHVDYIARHLPKRLAYTPASISRWKLARVGQEELDRRRRLVHRAIDAILDASIVLHDGGWYALDGTGTWTWARSKKIVKDDHDVREGERVVDDPDLLDDERVRDEIADKPEPDQPAVTDDDDTEPEESDIPTIIGGRKLTGPYDPDAAYGSKTAKIVGREPYFGYVIDAAIRIPGPNQPKRPIVLQRLVLSPANADVVGPTLEILDSLLDTPGGVTDIVVDRHYSFKDVFRWADELRVRGINQHFDLTKLEQGFTDVDGMRMVAGWMHCPATPDRLADIPRPGPGSTKAQRDKFAKLIAQRQVYSLDRHEAARKKDGRTRWKCPAKSNKVGCALREGTLEVAKEAGLPIITNPPEKATATACCTNSSGIAATTIPKMRKHQQPHYWGSKEWQEAYNQRTYVEGFFGSLKNMDTEKVSRGFTKFVGLPMVSLGLGLAAAVCNVRHQRNFWKGDEDRPDHPLLAPDPEFHGWAALTREQADDLDQRHRSDAA